MNRRILYIILAFFFCFSNKIESQDSIPGKIPEYSANNHILKSNPFTVFWSSIPLTGEYRLCYENRISQHSSFQIGASYLGKAWLYLLMEDSLYDPGEPHLIMRGYRFQFSYRYYFESHDLEGFYCSAHYSYSSCKFSYKQYLIRDEYIRAVHKNLNFLLGYQRFMDDRFGIDIFCGLGIRENTWMERYNQQNTIIDDLDDFYPYEGRLKITLGFNFICLL